MLYNYPTLMEMFMIVRTLHGNVFKDFEKGLYDGFIHECNCYCSIVGEISYRYPEAVVVDRMSIPGDKSKLGTYSKVDTRYGKVINLYTYYSKNASEVGHDINAILASFKALNDKHTGQSFCIKKIGNQMWSAIEQYINESTPDIDIYVYE